MKTSKRRSGACSRLQNSSGKTIRGGLLLPRIGCKLPFPALVLRQGGDSARNVSFTSKLRAKTHIINTCCSGHNLFFSLKEKILFFKKKTKETIHPSNDIHQFGLLCEISACVDMR